MLDLFSGSVYALESKYFSFAKGRILARLEKGLPALSAAEVKPRHYAHVDAEGYPTSWLATPTPAGTWALNQALAAALAGPAVVAARGGSAGVLAGSAVAVIPVQGTIQKRGGMCSTGTKQLAQMLASANADSQVGSIVLDIDSPGGAVDGTEEFANLVAASRKPVVAHIDGLGASAAYWIASQARHISISSATTAYAGSLGVLCTHVAQGQALEKSGQQVTILRSTRAKDKARFNGLEPLTDELKASITADLDTIAGTFISAVETGRAGKLSASEDVFTGKVYAGQDARQHGLVDSIGTLQDAINQAAKLGRESGGASALTSQLSNQL
jgi:protease-4